MPNPYRVLEASPNISAGACENSDDLSILDGPNIVHSHPLLRWNQHLAWVAFLVMLGVVAYLSATATWALLGYGSEQPVSSTAVPVTPVSASPPRVNVDAIVDAHLFGPLPPPTAPTSDTPPDTDLELLLKGIVFSDVPTDARAIIAAPGGTHDAYGIDAYVPGNARVLEIRHTLVVLERDGHRETLRLENKRQQRLGEGQTSPPHRRIDKRGDYQLSKILGRFQARLQTDPASAMSLLGVTPERNGEHMQGVRIYAGPEPGLIERLELQPNDLITHINGQAINSAARGLEALRTLAAAPEITLQVLRGKRRLALSFRVVQ